MSCCGQKRARASLPADRPAAVPAGAHSVDAGFAAAARPAQGMAEIEYVAQSPVVVRGPVTGATYQFSAAAPIQRVYREDASVLLATRYFRPAAGSR